MKTDVIEILKAAPNDPEFPKKYLITVLTLALSFLVVPAAVLVGYLAETIKYVSSGKKDLPEWKDYVALAVQGGASMLTGLYLLPAAILFAIAVVTSRSGGATGISMLTTFIFISGLLIGFVGLAVSATAVHTYMHSDTLMDLFHFPNIAKKMKNEAGNIGYLFGAVGLMTLGIQFVSQWLSWAAYPVLVLTSAFLSIALAYGVGQIYGQPETEAEVKQEALPVGPESAAQLPVGAEPVWDPSDEQDDSDVWMPK